MKKTLLLGLLLTSMFSMYANREAHDIINKHISMREVEDLIKKDGIEEHNKRLRHAIKQIYLARADKLYDLSWYEYIKSYIYKTEHYKTLETMNCIDQNLRHQYSALHNNTWEQWGWSLAKYSSIVLATIIVLKEAEIRTFIAKNFTKFIPTFGVN